MPESEEFAFDLSGPLELYGCAQCGSDRIEPFGPGEILCLDCRETTTPDQWVKWCNDREIDVELGPFLQALKNVKERAALQFDPALSRSRYLGDANRKARERALTNPELKAAYTMLRARKRTFLRVDEL